MKRTNYNCLNKVVSSSPFNKTLLALLREKGELSRTDVCKLLNVPRTTVFDNLDYLYRKELIQKKSVKEQQRGRPIILWKILKPKYTITMG